MVGFFSLSGDRETASNTTTNHHHHHQNEINPDNYFVLRNEDITYNFKGFELWQHNQQVQHHHQQVHHLFQDLYPGDQGGGHGGLGEDPQGSAVLMMGAGGGGGGGDGGGRGVSCQDCGNQAKKDCAHMRCRTCCKSRGFQCQTHVKSTWVPAAKRRERQQQLAQHQQFLQLHRENPPQKRQRESRHHLHTNSSPSLLVTNFLAPNASGLEIGNFPPEVTSPAVFRCVRVSSMEDDEDQYAYQTSVNIAGREFKGILYDQGPESQHNSADSPPAAGELNLVTGCTASSSGAASLEPPQSGQQALAFLEQSSFYPPTNNNSLNNHTGTQFFPHHPRS